MNIFFNPAISLMNRLKFPQKFILVGVVLLIPFLLIFFQFVANANATIAFSAKERIGLEYNAPVMGLLQNFQLHRGLTTQIKAGNTAVTDRLKQVQTDIESQIKAVDQIDQRLGTTLLTTTDWNAIKKEWTTLREEYAKYADETNFERHTQLIQQVLNLMIVSGNNSNLILDPDLDSYYYMDLVINRLPLLSEQVAKLGSFTNGVITRGRINMRERGVIPIYEGSARQELATSLRSFQYSADANPTLGQTMQVATVTPFRNSVTTYLDTVRGTFLMPNAGGNPVPIPQQPGAEPGTPLGAIDPNYQARGDDAVNGVFNTYERVLPELDRLLVKRISGFETQRNLAIFGALVAFLLAVYLSIGFALAVRRTISSLSEFTKHMVEGKVEDRLVLENRDELATITLSFNNIAHELLKARDNALEASRAKSAFLANMSHELRTPLNAVIGYAELIEEECEDMGQEDFIPDLKKIQASARHLLALINDILDLSKIEAGKMDVYLEIIDVPKMIKEIQATILPLAQKKNNQLEIICPPDIGQIRADLTKTRQILFNLLSNASKFTENGTVTLKVWREQLSGADQILFSVKDTGIGMTPEQVGKLFQDFAQADASTTRKYGGTGLGLAISRRFAQMMGGNIGVESLYGSGSIFTVNVPAAIPRVESALVPQISEMARGGRTILIIDDDPTAREVLSRFLVREGYIVEQAVDGKAGLNKAREIKPDAITLDVMMPEMDGWSVLGQLKADPDLRAIPVIMTTMVGEKQTGYALGASEYLVKPVDRDHLLDVLRRYQLGEKPRVLVVEDDPTLREMVRRVLEKENVTVDEAENGKVALQRVADSPPNLILLDLMMPEMNGFEFLDALRQNMQFQGVPVVVMTAMTLTNDQRELLNGQVKSVIQKGTYQGDLLFAELRSLIGKYAKPHPNSVAEDPSPKQGV